MDIVQRVPAVSASGTVSGGFSQAVVVRGSGDVFQIQYNRGEDADEVEVRKSREGDGEIEICHDIIPF